MLVLLMCLHVTSHFVWRLNTITESEYSSNAFNLVCEKLPKSTWVETRLERISIVSLYCHREKDNLKKLGTSLQTLKIVLRIELGRKNCNTLVSYLLYRITVSWRYLNR
ncbi:uncharacterized protein LOC116159209 [Photinus pyralis]|uniref:uncharacterized protein LOC116159209 n=1 Tax=Photinus pyralis TaxID=7054 RepID=UPI001267117D|nr:uncharacterized protein LOC116159209 [Photinus pyralis]